MVNAFAVTGISLTCPAPPKADFSGTPTSGGASLAVNFTDISSNGPNSGSWTFPGGTPSSSTAQNPSVTYASAVTYDVTLISTYICGND